MSNKRNLDEVYYIDKDIEHLQMKRNRITRDEATKEELENKLIEWESIHLPIDHDPKLSEKTIGLYVGHVKGFLKSFVPGSVIGKKEVNEYREYVIQKYASKTAENKFVSVSKFLVYCGLYDIKIKKVKIQEKASIDNVITNDQFKRLLSASKRLAKTDVNNSRRYEEMYLIIRTIGMCGIRINEREFITYENLKKGSIVEIFFKGKYKPIFINEKVRSELLEYAEKYKLYEGCIFSLTDNQIRYSMKVIVREAKIRNGKFNPHAFRHFFAINFMEQVGDIQVLKQVLGHANIETTAIYLKQTNANVRDIVNTLEFGKDSTKVANTERGRLVKEFEKEVYSFKGTWTKKAAIKIFMELINSESERGE